MRRGTRALWRRITAYHEAGHAVLALKFGIGIDEVALCRAGPLAGYVRMLGGWLVANAAKDSRATELTWNLVKRDTEQRIMVFLAGALSEAKLLGTPLRSHGCRSDLQKCLLLCDVLSDYRRQLVQKQGMSIPEIDPAEMTERLRRRTKRVLGDPDTWRAVAALAGDLEGWGRLTGHDTADTVQWARRVRDQLVLLLPMPAAKSPKTRRRAGRATANGSRFAASRAPLRSLSNEARSRAR
jgi:hypothetical protein